MNRAELARRAVDIAERLVPEDCHYSVSSRGWVHVTQPDEAQPPPASMGLELQRPSSQHADGWYGGADDGVWWRSWQRDIEGVTVSWYQTHRGELPAEAA